ncbi:MAG TPA: AAA family ATPase, partial [Actinomycetota bacterium]|nr:AAA family ATPase [Actinomycetota bacterium]
ERVAEARSCQLFTLLGSAGVGKSRLAAEFIASIATEATVLRGHCLSYGEGITYWPIAEIVSQVGDVRAALGGDGDADLVAARVEAAIGSGDATATPEEIAWGFRRLLEGVAASAPLIVIFDDIHWGEPALLDLIEYVATFARDVPLLLLCMARPDLFELRQSWTTPRPNATLITLEPLSGSDSEALVTLLGRVSARSHARIVEAAEGNPLFVEQLVAMQAETGDGELEVPPTLQALLSARIDRLAEPERAVVERGSVEGRLFHRGAVAALLPESERRDVGGHLLRLVRKELIRPDRATLPGDDGFRFGHILIRDAAYEAIPKRQRAVLHETYADWLASRLGDDAPDEIVGYHLEQAFRYGAELGAPDAALAERAAERLADAGHAARARRDAAATLNLLGRAVDLVGEASRPDLLVPFGEALQLTGETTHARQVLEEAASGAAAARDRHVEWLARLELVLLHLDTEPEGAADVALREAETAAASPEMAGDHEVLARAWDLIAEVHNLRGQLTAWQRASEQAAEHARLTGNLALEVPIVSHSAGPIVYGPVPVDEGLRYADDVRARLGHVPEVQAFALHVRAHMLARLGESEGAFEAVSEWRRHKRELGQEAMYATTAACAWDVCFWAGDGERGEEALREGVEMLERMGRTVHVSTMWAHLGEAVALQGRFDEAERLSEVSEELGASDDVYNETAWRRVRAKALAGRGEVVRAEVLARQAVEVAAGAEFLDDAALAWLTLAGILRDAGDPEARTAAAEARALFDRKGNLVGARWASAFLDPALGD